MVRTDYSQIDARLESRISTIIANAFGDERAADRAAAPAATQAGDPHSSGATPHAHAAAGVHGQPSAGGPVTIGTPVGDV
jgi:hypothetical protein